MTNRQDRGARPEGDRRHNRRVRKGEPKDLLAPPERPVEYFANKGKPGEPIVRRELLDEEAMTEAREFANGLKTTQLRRFYGEVQAIKRATETANLQEDGIRARLALLKAHAVYAKGQKKVPDAFVKFIVLHASSVKTRDDFLRGFVPHFEAVVAYHRLYAKE